MKLIIKYCECLNEIKLELDILSLETIVEFGQKFGEKLKIFTITLKCNPYEIQENDEFIYKYKTLLSFCPNLVSFIDHYSIHSPKLSLLIDNNVLLLP
jgi:hypothetical protein